MHRLLPLTIGCVLLAGCAQVRGGSQIGTEKGYGCPIAEREPFPSGTPDGFPWSVGEAMEATLGPTEGTNEDEQSVTLNTTLLGEVQLVTTFVPADMGEMDCPDLLEIPVELILEGPDVSETLRATVNAYANGTAFTGFSIPGSTTSTPQPPEGTSTLELAAWLEQGWEGEVFWLTETQAGTGDDATVSLEREDLWSFHTLF